MISEGVVILWLSVPCRRMMWHAIIATWDHGKFWKFTLRDVKSLEMKNFETEHFQGWRFVFDSNLMTQHIQTIFSSNFFLPELFLFNIFTFCLRKHQNKMSRKISFKADFCKRKLFNLEDISRSFWIYLFLIQIL